MYFSVTVSTARSVPWIRHLDADPRPTEPSELETLLPVRDVTEDREDPMTSLEIAAAEGDERAFLRATDQIDWSLRSAGDFVRAVRLALAAGAHMMARILATEGHSLRPEHAELAKMARILAPPRVLRDDLPPDPSVARNQTWMRSQGAKYKGQWVALSDGKLLAAAPSASELSTKLARPSFEGLFVTRVI